MLASIGATVTGSGGGVLLAGSGDTVTTSNETIGVAANDQNESVTGTGDTIFESANVSTKRLRRVRCRRYDRRERLCWPAKRQR